MTHIYKIINLINGKLYIGKTSKTIHERFVRHKQMARNKVNRVLYDAINKYGEDNFIIDLIEDVDGDGDLEEIKWISYYRSNIRE